MRILFAASSDIALPSLAALAASQELVGVLSAPDARSGRGMGVAENPVAVEASRLLPGLPILKCERLDASAREAVAALAPQLLAVFSYGKIFGPKFLSLFPSGGVNVHPSLLPRWRGCSPIPAAILAGDRETGVVVQRIALKMDSGDILARRVLPLDGRETTTSLSATAALVGAELLVQAVGDIEAGRESPEPQDDALASYCGMIGKEAGLVDWLGSAEDIDRRIRAYTPWPLAYSSFLGLRLNLLEAQALSGAGAAGKPGQVLSIDKKRGILVQTGDGILAVTRLQLEKKKALPFMDFVNGTRGFVGAILGAEAPPPGRSE